MKKYGKIIALLGGLIVLIGGAGIAYTALKDQVEAPSALDQVAQTEDGNEDVQESAQEVPEKESADEKESSVNSSETEAADQGTDSGTEEQDAETDSSSDQRQQAVDFTVFDDQGQEVRLSDFYGKPVVVNFWATWCGYCKQEMPDFQETYDAYKDQVNFLMIQSTDGSRETKEMGQAYIQEEGFTFPVYYDENREAVYLYSVYSLPTTILLDAEGRVAAYNPGLVEKEPLTAAIEQLLKEQENG